MSERADPVRDTAVLPSSGDVDWRELYERSQAECAALAEQVRSLERVRQQLSAYAADLNRTYLELRRRLNQMTVLHEVGLQIGALLEVEAVLIATLDGLQRLVPASAAHLFLQERGSCDVRARRSWAADGARATPPSAYEHELVREVMASGRPRVERRRGRSACWSWPCAPRDGRLGGSAWCAGAAPRSMTATCSWPSCVRRPAQPRSPMPCSTSRAGARR